MISKGDGDFLQIIFDSEVSATNPVTDMELTENRIKNLRSRSIADPTSNVKRFFQPHGYEVCQNCDKTASACSCSDKKSEEVYYPDVGYIVGQWTEELSEFDFYEDIILDSGGGDMVVKVVTEEFGEILFKVVTDTDSLTGVQTGVSSKEFVVSLVESDEVAKEDNYFMWYQLISEEGHKNLHAKIRDAYSLLFERICDLDSEAATNNINAIHENVRKYLSSKGFSQVDVTHAAGGAGRVLDFNKVDLACEASGGVVVICGCDKSGGDMHLHYIVDGDVQPVSNCQPAKNAAKRMQKRLSTNETLRQNSYEMQGRTRAFLVAGGVISIGPIIAGVTGILNLNAASLTGYPYYPRALFSVLLIALLVVLLLPAIRISLFSWDIRNRRVKIADWGPFGNSS